MRKAFLLILILANFRLFAEEKESLEITREKAVELALIHSRDEKISRIDLDQSKRASDSRWNELLPQLSATADLNTAGGKESFSNGENPFDADLSLGLSFTLDPAVRENIKQKKINYSIQNLNMENTVESVKNNIDKMFYYLLASGENIAIKEKALLLAEKQYAQAQINFKNGLESELQVLQARISVENQKPDISSARLDYENTLMSFKDMLGIDKGTPVYLKGELEIEPFDLDGERLIGEFLHSTADIVILEKTAELNSSILKGARKSAYIPSFSVSGSYTNTLNDFTENIPSASQLSANSGEWTDSASVTLALTWSPNPLLKGSKENLSLKSAQDSLRQSAFRLDDALETLERDINSRILELETYRDNLELSRMNIILAEKSYQMTEESFGKGTAERLEVEEARQDWETAHQNYLSGLYQYRSGLLDLAFLLNTDIETLREVGKNE